MSDNIGRLDATLPALTVKAYGYCEEQLMERKPLELTDKEAYLDYLKSIAERYPFLAVMGLRVLSEITIREMLRQSKRAKFHNDRCSFNDLILELQSIRSLHTSQIEGLRIYRQFENMASHGNEVSVETAQWALEAIPAILNEIKAKPL
ncbi:MAG: hypothetical protein HQL06_15905 [Nitrospirae bacterium]|nr:hypothetical protein [Nitrospirota bacterium]